MKFGGAIISAEKIKDQSIIFLDPPNFRILAITEMPALKTKKELQSFCGMISSLQGWFPNVSFSNKNLRAGTTQGTKFIGHQTCSWNSSKSKGFFKIKLGSVHSTLARKLIF